MTKAAVIIGGGPAGCQCALWLKMLGHTPVIIERADQLGGLQALSPYTNNWMVGVMNYTGRELASLMEKHIEQMEIPVHLNSTVTKIENLRKGFAVHTDQKVIEAYHLVIATGVLSRHPELHAADNVLIGPGQRVFDYDFSNKRVAILGGGDNAAVNYEFIMEKKPKVCHVFARTIRARKNLWGGVNPQDVFLYPYEVNQESMTVTHRGMTNHYDVIVAMYGWEANIPEALAFLKSRLVDERGFIMTDRQCETPVSHIFAIGEVANRSHPCVVTAMADGVIAAKTIQERLEG